MAKVVFRVVLFAKPRKCTVCRHERRLRVEQVGFIACPAFVVSLSSKCMSVNGVDPRRRASSSPQVKLTFGG